MDAANIIAKTSFVQHKYRSTYIVTLIYHHLQCSEKRKVTNLANMSELHQQPQEEHWIRVCVKKHCSQQSELPLSILWNSVESDLDVHWGFTLIT